MNEGQDKNPAWRFSVTNLMIQKGRSKTPPAEPVAYEPSLHVEKRSIERSFDPTSSGTADILQGQYEEIPLLKSHLYVAQADPLGMMMRRHWRFLCRFLWILLLSVATGVIMAVAYTHRQPESFSATSKLLVHKKIEQLTLVDQEPALKDDLPIYTWARIIQSDEIASRVAERLNIDFTALDWKNRISVEIERGEEAIMAVSAQASEPQLAARITNAICFALNDYDNQLYAKNFSFSSSNLSSQEKSLQLELENINQEIYAFFKRRNFDVTLNNIGTTLDNVHSYEQQLATARVDLEAVSANVDQLRSQLSGQDSSLAIDHSFDEPLQVRLINLEMDLANELTTYGEEHPRINSIRESIDNVKKLIAAGSRNNFQARLQAGNRMEQGVLTTLIEKEGEKTALVCKTKALERIIQRYAMSSDDLSALNTLERKKDSLERLLASLQNQINELQIKENVQVNRISLLEEAKPASMPLNKPFARNIVLSLFMSMLFGVAVMKVVESAQDRFYHMDDFLQQYPLPSLGALPAFTEPRFKSKKSQVAQEASRSLNTVFKMSGLVLYYTALPGQRILGVVSPGAGDGRSGIAFQFALALAKDGKKTLFIDSDFSNQDFTRRLKSESKIGLSEVMNGSHDALEAVQYSGKPNLWYLTAGRVRDEQPWWFDGFRFESILVELRRHYDFIFIDMPAILAHPESLHHIKALDGVIVVCDLQNTRRKDFQSFMQSISLVKTKPVGVFFNRLPKPCLLKSREPFMQRMAGKESIFKESPRS